VRHLVPDGHFLAPAEASRLYDRIGRLQDWQAIYERAPLRELIRAGAFESATSILEFGCGTGAFAAKLLAIVPSDCRYVGIDVSPTMVRIASSRLSGWAGRAIVRLSDGSPRLREPDASFDRFVANYVFDLLAPEYVSTLLAEAHRVLTGEGKLCLVSLGRGRSGLARVVTAGWEAVWKRRPQWVGGCRPLELRTLLPPKQWLIEHYMRVSSFGIASEMLVADGCSE
jgi:ubiquinone/menaquinone biosynthesis C-methylase UbiE